MARVVLRYALEDFQAVHPIIEALSEAGLQAADASRRGMKQLELDLAEQVEIDFGVTGCVVVVWSRAAAQSQFVEFELRHTMAAWSSDRLVLAKLDDAPLPVGLRDLPAILIPGPSQSGTKQLIEHVIATVKARPFFAEPKKILAEGLSTARAAPPSAPSAPTRASPRRYSWAVIPAGALSVVCGAVLIAVLLAMFIREPSDTLFLLGFIVILLFVGAATGGGPVWVWTAWRRYSWVAISAGALSAVCGAVLIAVLLAMFIREPGLPADPSGVNMLPGVNLPEGSDTLFLLGFIVILLFVGAAVGGGAVWVWTARSRRRVTRRLAMPSVVPLMSETPSPAGGPPEVFVSYSHKDAPNVEQLVKQIEQLGYAVWIDRQSGGSQRYAAPIVQAIRMSRLVALMCSQNAFASDHVVREIYVAGDCKKPFIAFLLDPAEFPDEILYFLSGFPRIAIASIDQQQLRSEIARLVAPNLH